MSPWFSDALLRTQTDERLVALARDGHERAFVAIVDRYRRPLLAFARRFVHEGRAEDVLQQAFLNAWAALGRGAEVRHLSGWLHQIVRNVALAASTPGHEPLPDTMIDIGDTPSRVEERLLIAQTLDNLAALPDHQREAIVKTVMEGRSREEVASSLGVTEGAVRAMLNRARTTLRAAATAVTPLPLAVWAASAAERSAEVAAAGGGAGLAAAAAKAGAVVAVTGAVATTVAGDRLPLVHDQRTPTQAPTAQPHERKVAEVGAPRAPGAAPVRRTTAARPVAAAPGRTAPRPAARVVRVTTHAAPVVRPTVVRHRSATERDDAGEKAPSVAASPSHDDGADDHQQPATVATVPTGESDGADTSDGHDGAGQTTQPDRLDGGGD